MGVSFRWDGRKRETAYQWKNINSVPEKTIAPSFEGSMTVL
jgi:hypothetical protein